MNSSQVSPLERLPAELLDLVLLAGLLSEPPSSHDALHTFRQLIGAKILEGRITQFFRRPWLQQTLRRHCGLWPDYEHAYHCRDTIDENARFDMVSFCTVHCNDCIVFLLTCHVISPSTFGQHGQSLFFLAANHESFEVCEQLLRLMGPKQILEPCRVFHGASSILQYCASKETWFRICWSQVKSYSGLGPSALLDEDLASICEFVDAQLADSLFSQGIDLVRLQSQQWGKLLWRQNPDSMFDWFRDHHCNPPSKLLKRAIQMENKPAVSWLYHYGVEGTDWREATLEAATSQWHQSEEVLQLLLRTPSDIAVLSQDLLIEVFQGIKNQTRISGDCFSSPPEPLGNQSDLQNLGVRKMRTIGAKVCGRVQIPVGLKVAAREAGLYDIQNVMVELETDIETRVNQ